MPSKKMPSISQHILNRSKLILSGILLCTSTMSIATPEVEVMHWWYRGGESRAMQVLRDEFENRGGIWHNVAGSSSTEVLNKAVSRMSKGYAPTLVQWNSAWEIAQIKDLGLLNNFDPDIIEFLQNSLLDNVLDMVTVNGEIVAVPVDIHSENWLWLKQNKNAESTIQVTKDWSSFLAHAEQLAIDNKVALAVGSEPWQQRILFNNILLGVAGQSLFETIFNDLDSSALHDNLFLQAINIFTSLIPFSQSFGEGRWDQQIAAIAANRAYAVTMGDWAKNEFKNLGLRYGREYQCLPAPGTANNVILKMDVFVLGQVSNENEKQGQQLFVDVVTDPQVSEAFNYLKGSLPPLRQIDSDTLDDCSQLAYKTLQQKGSAIRPHASIGDRGFINRIDNLIGKLWSGDNDTSEWISNFGSVLESENLKRRSASQLSQN